jgi:transcription initiation factor TFIID subunit 12
MEHVAKFPYVVPSNMNPNGPEAQKWISEAKNRYLKGLVSMEASSNQLTRMDAMVAKRIAENKPLNPDEEKDYKEQKEKYQKTHAESKNFVDGFRRQQQEAKAAKEAREASNSNAGQGIPTTQQPANTNNSQAAPTRPQMNPQQQPANPALQNTQTVNAAIEAARQQIGGARPQMNQNGQMSQPQQVPTPTAPSMPQPNIKTEAGVPPAINTAITQMQQRPSLQNSPQSAVPQSAGAPQSATSQAQQIPRALTHSAALTQAARSYSSGGAGSASQVMAHSHPSAAPRESQNVMTNKMPVPKVLHDRAAAPPQPVAISNSRPTYSGGASNVGTGVMAQPVLPKTPGYNMASDDNRVLSRKKLDELVKQVTGGGQGDGPSLMPEVEEVSSLSYVETKLDLSLPTSPLPC